MSPQNKIRLLVSRWYGLIGMPLRILKREEEVEQYEKRHPEVPPAMWEFVDHRRRQALLWCRNDDVDIVVEHHGALFLLQDLIFRDQYETVEDWHRACQAEILSIPNFWVVFHDDGPDPLDS